MFDVLLAKDVLCNDTPTYLIKDGTKCQVRFCGKFYPVIIMGTGATNVRVDVHVKWFIALTGDYTAMC